MTSSITPVNAVELRRLLDERQAILIDIREPDEHAREHIVGARLAPLSSLQTHEFGNGRDKIAVFHCRSGNRTQANADRLRACGFTQIYCLDGGIEAWKAAGLPVRRNTKAPLEIMRQVQIAAGSLILAGAALGATTHPAFYGLAAFVGAGLLFAGATGWCGMAMLLKAMPWNRTPGV
ncbi:MAG: rhodanese family protein [Terricaulis sp.]